MRLGAQRYQTRELLHRMSHLTLLGGVTRFAKRLAAGPAVGYCRYIRMIHAIHALVPLLIRSGFRLLPAALRMLLIDLFVALAWLFVAVRYLIRVLIGPFFQSRLDFDYQ